MEVKEGYMPFKGYQTWYKIVGEPSEKVPLVLLHGGPGGCHNYMEPYEAIAEKYGRQVITYDQIGCGKSPIPHQEDDFYNIQLWVDELAALREHLSLEKMDLLGHSWGSMLAMEYVLRGGKGVNCMILASGLVSTDQWLEESARLVSYLPEDMAKAIRDADETGDYSSDIAQQAQELYYMRHVMGAGEPPKFLMESMEGTGECYVVMQGPAEFTVVGKLKGWDIIDRLPEIKVPTMMISGNDDESTPLINKTMNDLIPGSKWVLIPHGTHMGFCYEPEPYVEAAEAFLEEHDK
ncbi:MAG: proline iminopeptidase-family hydrolase [Eubacterium sp.]|nr:proline iminopeptidase-family hydrolase [Eubacterium sp.]